MPLLTESEPVADVPPRLAAPAAGRPRWQVLGAAVVGAWLLPLLTHAVGADIVLLAVLWLGTASLLRSGRTLVDRLFLAGAVLSGAIGTLGFLASMWPFGLHPVPLAGLCFTVLIAVSAATGRRPHLPRVGYLSELFLLGAVGAVALFIYVPMIGRTDAERLSMVIRGEDISRHFAMFDGIRRFGGYLAFNKAEIAPALQEGFETYPQGSHLALAFLYNFVYSDAGPGVGRDVLDNYLWLYGAMFVALCAAVLWAARWVGGARLRGLLYLPVAGFIATYLFFADGITLLLLGFASQIAATLLLALLVAVTARPLADPREQLVVVASLVAAVSLTYYLFLFGAALALLAWAVFHRRMLWQQRRWVAGVLLVAVPVTLFAPLSNLQQANSVSQLGAGGGVERLNRHILVPLLVLVVAGLVTRYGRRAPVYRMMSAWLASTGAFCGGLFLYQTLTIGRTSYYFEKTLHQVLLVTLVATGAIALLGFRPGSAAAVRRRPLVDRSLPLTSLAIAVVVAVIAFGGPYNKGFLHPPDGMSWGRGYLDRWVFYPQPAEATMLALDERPQPDGMVSVVLWDKTPDDYAAEVKKSGDREVPWFDGTASYFATLFVSVLHRNYGDGWRAWIWTLGGVKTQEQMEELIRTYPHPIRFVTNSEDIRDTAEQAKAANPQFRVEVVYIDPEPQR